MAKSIVMVHGMWGGAWCWDIFKSYFERKGYECHVPVLRHHDVKPGEPPPVGLGTTGLADYVRDLEEYIQKLPEKPILMGHSMGGLLVQLLSQKDIALKSVLLTPAPPAGIHALTYSVFKCFLSMFLNWGFWRKPHRIPFKRAEYAFLHQLPDAEKKDAYDKLVYEAGKASFQIGFWLLDSERASHVDEDKIKAPQLIITATNDRIVPASVVRKIAKKYERTADFKEFESHSHWLIGEDGWEDIAAFVLEWIEKKPAAM